MPPAFDKCANSKGSRIRTITKGPNKGRLICIIGKKVVMGEHRKDLDEKLTDTIKSRRR